MRVEGPFCLRVVLAGVFLVGQICLWTRAVQAFDAWNAYVLCGADSFVTLEVMKMLFGTTLSYLQCINEKGSG